MVYVCAGHMIHGGALSRFDSLSRMILVLNSSNSILFSYMPCS
jgi:hypothetical protein